MERDLLTEDDKKFIVENYSKMSVLQMAIRLGIKTENRKCSVIEQFVRNSNLQPTTRTPRQPTAEVKLDEVSIKEVAEQIVSTPITVATPDEVVEPEKCSLDDFAQYLKDIGCNIHAPLSERERREINFCLAQLSSTRFNLMYKSFRNKDYRKLFKEEFVKGMYGKGEMPAEEVNDFMDLANEMVTQHDTKCKTKELDKIKENKDTSVAQKLVLEQVLSDLGKQYGESVKRASDIKKTLGTHREQRLKENRTVGLTVALLLEAVYDTEKREELVRLQDKTDEKLKKVIAELEEFSETKAMLLGVSPAELMDGSL